jgi:hypothetical protein
MNAQPQKVGDENKKNEKSQKIDLKEIKNCKNMETNKRKIING